MSERRLCEGDFAQPFFCCVKKIYSMEIVF